LTDGEYPSAALALGADGNFYGTTIYGGALLCCGTVFKITPSGALNTLHSFNSTDGEDPSAGLLLANDGNFYGTTSAGVNCGTVFRITPTGTLTTVHAFSGPDGCDSVAALALGSDGKLYGTTKGGGANQYGTVFSVGLSSGSGTPSINLNGAVNAASYTSPVAAGSIASVFGNFLLALPVYVSSLPIPTSLSGLSFQFGGAVLAPLFYANLGQANAQVPWELAGETQTTITASMNGQTSTPQTVNLAAYAPGIFTANGEGAGPGAILDGNYRLVSSTNPTTAGAIVQIYCTGLGPVTNQPATGSPSPSNPLASTTTLPTVMIGGAPATVQFSGLAPEDVGLYQVNAYVPQSAARGSAVPIVISISGVQSNVATIAVQ
jgi:uncharacterized protein (TIGR03437 family)